MIGGDCTNLQAISACQVIYACMHVCMYVILLPLPPTSRAVTLAPSFFYVKRPQRIFRSAAALAVDGHCNDSAPSTNCKHLPWQSQPALLYVRGSLTAAGLMYALHGRVADCRSYVLQLRRVHSGHLVPGMPPLRRSVPIASLRRTPCSRDVTIGSVRSGWRSLSPSAPAAPGRSAVQPATAMLVKESLRQDWAAKQAAACTDKDVQCPNWAATGGCSTSVAFMAATCALSCRTCTILPPAPLAPAPTTATGCSDSNAMCAQWAQQGECNSGSRSFMLVACARTCGACTAPAATAMPAVVRPSVPSVCVDTEVQCAQWAANGECTSSRVYMGAACCKTCATAAGALVTAVPALAPNGPSLSPTTECTDLNTQCITWKATGECTGASAAYMRKQCPKSCGACGTASPTAAPVLTCDDLSPLCVSNAATGQCLANPGVMLAQCPRSCGTCGLGGVTAVPTVPCLDTAVECAQWFSAGECYGTSMAQMIVMCPKSCSACVAGGAPVYLGKKTYAVAAIAMDGVVGQVFFTQQAGVTTVQLSLRGLRENASQYAIYTNTIGPQPPTGPSPSQCSASGLGGLYNPLSLDVVTGYGADMSCKETEPMCATWATLGECSLWSTRKQCPETCKGTCPTVNSKPCNPTAPAQCAVGDLSGKFSPIPRAASYDLTFTDASLRLDGPTSVAGRALVIHDPTGKPWVCATIIAVAGPATGIPSVAPSKPILTRAPTDVGPTLSPATCVDVIDSARCATEAPHIAPQRIRACMRVRTHSSAPAVLCERCGVSITTGRALHGSLAYG
jgi:hypothetical protein